jgi:hypothetical protein
MAFYEQSRIFHGQYLRAAMRQLHGPVAAQDLPPAHSSDRLVNTQEAFLKSSSENQF